ncbi:N-6 DNA methylase [Brumimicrobium oceani]|uniref:DNA methyltransferase n=1 Tax=Brumimicrobium oceani TaxID=2100725 RepID=A0A2U2XB16_9FLAO|nr:N-6 DNA methylase [Brumimicrobium oceani]PWH84982.1 DNA methyltransferase [Brumimicrobium oceani]
MTEDSLPKEGYLFDYISGQEIKATPEEVDAVQPFSIQLVEDYGYPKELIQTRPQFRVKARPSDTTKQYPVDIAIFKDKSQKDDDVYIIVECKKKTRKDGKTQLEDYLRLSKAELGVWFNGDERLFIKKIEKSGKVLFREIPNIPKSGQRLEDIGMFKRKDLIVPHNLKLIFKTIRNHLAGNFTGATRDEELARELINLIFCKIYDEKFTRPDDIVEFRIGIEEDKKEVKKRTLEIFEKVKTKYKEVIEVSDTISLDENAIAYVIGELQNYTLIESERDVIAEAFETFIGYALKGAQGQFFTPRNIVKLLVEIVDPKSDELVIDPACGSGGFLVESLRYMWKELDKQAEEYGWSELALNEEKTATAIHKIRGIEKDSFLSKVAKAYMAIIGDGKGGIFCENSLDMPKEWKAKTRQNVNLGQFDVLLANPPFGKDIKVEGTDLLNQYDLGYKWKTAGDTFERTNKLKDVETPQIIFIERCLQLIKVGGRMGIVLPETFFHAPRSRYVLHKMLEGNNLSWVIDLPHNSFRPHNNAKCLAIVIEKGVKQQKEVNMAVLEEIGHNHQGKEIYRWDFETKSIDRSELWDDTPLVIKEIKTGFKKYCFKVDFNKTLEKHIYVPRYYWENKIEEIKNLAEKENLQLIPIKDLISKKILKCFDGHGSPPAEYKGRGEVTYVRVKDIVNWEVYKDPTSKIPEDIYLAKKGKKKDLIEGDVVYVRRGSYRIGSVAMVSPFDIQSLLTREILVLRVIKENNEYDLDSYYLLYLLSHSLTQLQSFNKVLIETTLPNIGDRWNELMLPISKDKEQRKMISTKIKSVIQNKWKAVEQLEKLKDELGDLTT